MDRRRFLGRVVGTAAGLVGAGFTALAGGYLFAGIDPGRRGRWTPVADFDRLEPERPQLAEYLEVVPDAWSTIRRRRSVWLVRRGRRLVAFDPRCTHLGCPYAWNDRDRVFECVCHGGVFDLDGRVLDGPPPRPLDRWPVRLDRGRVWVASTPARG